MLSNYCSEFLIHAADVEGLCQGVDRDLVQGMCPLSKHFVWLKDENIPELGKWVTLPTTYAGGAKGSTPLLITGQPLMQISRSNGLGFG